MRKLLSDSILDLRKCPSRKTHGSESECFLVWALPKVKNQIRKQCSHKVLYNFSPKFFVELFSLYLSSKKNISNCLVNTCAEGFRVFFKVKI